VTGDDPRGGPEPRVFTSRVGHILMICLNRPAKRNAWDRLLVEELADAYTTLEDDPDLRVGLVHAAGEDFTAGVDLDYFAGEWTAGRNPFAFDDGRLDPLGLLGRPRRTPVVIAVQGRCWTVGLELLLSADVRVAANNADFAQLEVLRGIYPGGGATIRLVTELGWGNAMRWLLTGDSFDAAEAHRLGLVQSVVAPDDLLPTATSIAERIAQAAPLGVQAIRESSRLAVEAGYPVAVDRLFTELVRLLTTTADGAEGLASFRERRRAVFRGE
jgi:enoyl-CoA hydratase/carnithine racemase